MPHAGEHHGHAKLVAGFDGEVVLLGTARLHDVLDAGLGCGFHVVREGEEGVGAHDDFAEHLLFESLETGLVDALALFVEELLGGLHAGHVVADAGLAEAEVRVDAVRLAGAKADDLEVAAGVFVTHDDGVRLGVLGHDPGEAGEGFLVLCELLLGDAFELFVNVHVAVLNQHATDHVLIDLAAGCLLDFAHFKETDVLGLVLQKFQSVLVECRGEKDFDELALQEFGGFQVHLLGNGDHGTEGRHRVTFPSGFHCVAQCLAGSESTGVHVLYDNDRIVVCEFAGHFQGGVGIHDVVVRKFLAPELLRGGEACFGAGRVAVEDGGLVGVFTVAQGLRVNEFQNEFFGHDFSFVIYDSQYSKLRHEECHPREGEDPLEGFGARGERNV